MNKRKIIYNLLGIGAILYFIIGGLQAQPLSGTRTIGGSGANYATINAAVADLAAKGINGPITFKIRPGTYNELINFPRVTGVSASDTIVFESSTGDADDVLIRAKGKNKFISPEITSIIPPAGKDGYQDHAVVRFYKSRYTTLRAVSVENTHDSLATAVHITNDDKESSADFNRVEKCKIYGNPNAESSIGIMLAYTIIAWNDLAGSFTSNISYNKIIQNEIYNTSVGISLNAGFVTANNASQPNEGNLVRGNKVFNAWNHGIYIWRERDIRVENNYVFMKPHAGEPETWSMAFSCHFIVKGMVFNNMFTGDWGDKNRSFSAWVGDNNNLKFYHNSVSYNGRYTVSPPNNNIYFASAFYLYENSELVDVDIRNNIFRASNGALAMNMSVRNTLWCNFESDYNVFWTNGPFLIRYGGTNFENLAQYNAFSHTNGRVECGKEDHSIQTDPRFLSDSNLHTYAPAINNKGGGLLSLYAVPYDYDLESRNAATPDPGADEFTPWQYDFKVEYAGFKNGIRLNDSASVEFILSNYGTGSLNGKTVTCQYSANGGKSWSPEESFTPALLGTTYAQEIFTFKKRHFPDSIGSRFLWVRIKSNIPEDQLAFNDTVKMAYCVGLRGVFTIGDSTKNADFRTISQALSLIRNCPIGGAVELKIFPGVYNETLLIGQVLGTDSNNRLTLSSFTGNNNDVFIVGRPAGTQKDHAAVRVDSASYITLKNLVIENQKVDGVAASGIHVTGRSSHIQIQNCQIRTYSALTLTGANACGIAVSGRDSIRSGTGDQNYINVQDCRIDNYGTGIFIRGGAGNLNAVHRITGNIINNATHYGIYSLDNHLYRINNNRVSMRNDSNTANTGIYAKNSSTHFELNGNAVYNYAMHGVLLEVVSGSGALLSNNMISGKMAGPTFNAALQLKNSDNINIYHNSVRADHGQKAVFWMEDVHHLNIKNNVFFHADTGMAYLASNSVVNVASDYNLLATQGTQLAFWNGFYNDLAQMQSGTGQEKNSVSGDPLYYDPQDLHAQAELVNAKAIFIPEVPFDFDQTQRNSASPDIGADEFSLGTDGALELIKEPSEEKLTQNKGYTVEVRVGNPGALSISGFQVWYYAGGDTVKENFTGTIFSGQSAKHVFAPKFTPMDTGTQQLCAGVNVAGDTEPFNDQSCKYYRIVPAPAGLKDLEMIRISQPTDSVEEGKGFYLTVDLKNHSNVTLTGFELRYSVNQVVQAQETFLGTVNAGAVKSYTFTKAYVPVGTDSIEVKAWVNLTDDTDYSNDSARIKFAVVKPTGIFRMEKLQAMAYPNPARGWVQIRTSDPIKEARLLGTDGKQISALQPLTGARFQLPVLPGGIYQLSITDARGHIWSVPLMIF